MKLIKVAGAALNQTPLDWDGNLRNILEAIAAARQARVGLLCLPELCITGYGCEDAFLSPTVQRTALSLLHEIAEMTEGMLVSVGLPLMHQNAVFNVAALLGNGEILGFVAKRHLAGDGIHYEPRWFKPWPEGLVAEAELADGSYPIGDLIFECGGVRIGFEICEDAWVARRPGAEQALKGVDVLLNPSASHFAFDKQKIRRRFVLEGSRAFNVTYVYSNLLGNEAGRAIYDGGVLIASAGELTAVGPRFSFQDVQLTASVVDVDLTRMGQARTTSIRPALAHIPGSHVRVDFEWPEVEPESPSLELAPWETGPHLQEEEFLRAEALGLFDYARKSRSQGFVVSLSGGADSAACACLVAKMAELASDELGVVGMLEKLRAPKALVEKASLAEANRWLLLCAYQSTRNSGPVTREAAKVLAEALGAEFHELDIDPIVQGYIDTVSKAIGRELNWEQDDVTLQNIQARARAPSIWMFANLRGALLLATSNRSEAAVGYTTMDGDTSGGLSPIAGIDKAFLRSFLRWLETTGPAGLSPIPALAAVNAQQPTAELRPQAAAQTDEADLMPYDLLDEIENAAIGARRSPVEVFRLMRQRFPDYSSEQLAFWVERFFRLWARNQWKRERYAPSFHVDDKNLDPRTWCRFPILSGGFERELAELRAFVAKQ